MTRFPVQQQINRATTEQIQAALEDPGFGHYYVDHVAKATWTPEQGWHDYEMAPVNDISMHPSAAVLHYAQEIFEGLKAYRHDDGSVWLFRPEQNAARFARSANRMAMQPFPEDDFLASVHELVGRNFVWVPTKPGHSLYIRPFMFASEPMIGVRAANEYSYLCLASPAGPYYPEPVRLWVSPEFSRAAAGGTGAAKCGGNYAASMAGELEAQEQGCQQVLWLDAGTRKNIEESGTMNFMAVSAAGELLTPALSGSVLPGITRKSLLQLADKHGLTPVERTLPLAEIVDGIGSGEIVETFACGTAAVITPVIGLRSPDFDVTVGDGQPGPKTMELREHLTGIQFGQEPDEFGWLQQVAEITD